MLKRFFVSLLGTVAGIWISFFLIVFGGLMLVGIAAGSETSEGIRDRSILYFDLGGVIEERTPEASFSDVLQDKVSKGPVLRDLIAALDKAVDDDRIEGVVLNCNGASMGFATCEELADAMARFKRTSDKGVYAYADSYEQGDYLLATI